MRLPTAGLLVALAAPAVPAAAQTRAQPQLLLTIFGGIASGASIWDITRQPLARQDDPASFDTLRLSRSLESAITLGASATFFPGSNLGITGEIAYLGYDLDDGCMVSYLDPALINAGENELVCADINGTGGSAATLAFTAGLLYRFASRAFASPYLRAHAGITARSGSTVEMQGRFLRDGDLQVRLVLDDPGGGSVNPTAAIGVGVMIPVARGYQVRLEARDHLLLVREATGPATSLLVPPTGTKLVHSAGLVVQLDIVLEQRRGRRY